MEDTVIPVLTVKTQETNVKLSSEGSVNFETHVSSDSTALKVLNGRKI